MTAVRREIGDLLVDNGVLTPEELEQVRTERAQTGDSITKVLSRLGLAEESQLKNTLELEFGVNFVSLSRVPMDAGLLNMLPASVVQEHQVVAIAHEGNRLTVAMVDPSDNSANEAVKSCLSDVTIKTVVCLEDEFQQFVRQYYQKSSRSAPEGEHEGTNGSSSAVPTITPVTSAAAKAASTASPEAKGSSADQAVPTNGAGQDGPANSAPRELTAESAALGADSEVAAAEASISTEPEAAGNSAEATAAALGGGSEGILSESGLTTTSSGEEAEAAVDSKEAKAEPANKAEATAAALGGGAEGILSESGISDTTDYNPPEKEPDVTDTSDSIAPIKSAEQEETGSMPRLSEELLESMGESLTGSEERLYSPKNSRESVDTGSFPAMTKVEAEEHLARSEQQPLNVSELELARRAQEEAIVLLANQILGGAIKKHCSNIHIKPHSPKQAIVQYRLNGQLFVDRLMPQTILTALIARYKMMARLNLSETSIPQDGHIKVKSSSKEIVCLLSTVPTTDGEHVVIWIV